MELPTFEIKKSTKGEYYFNLILNSETYSTKHNCLKVIPSVKTYAVDTGKYIRKILSNAEYYFTLLASKGEPTGKNPMYGSLQVRENAIVSVRVNGQLPARTISPLINNLKRNGLPKRVL